MKLRLSTFVARLVGGAICAVVAIATLAPAVSYAADTSWNCSPDSTRPPDGRVSTYSTCSGNDGSRATCTTNASGRSTDCRQTRPPSQSDSSGCQVVDDSPRVKYIPDCGGNVTVLCGSLDIQDYPSGTRHLSGPSCEQPTRQPSPAPAPAPAPPLPPPPTFGSRQVSGVDTFSTGNGWRSSQMMLDELRKAGYTGTTDLTSVVAAYQNATRGPVTVVSLP